MSETKIRVVELHETVDLGEGKTLSSYEYAIQYRNKTTHGLWLSVPVIRIDNNRDRYERMRDGSDD